MIHLMKGARFAATHHYELGWHSNILQVARHSRVAVGGLARLLISFFLSERDLFERSAKAQALFPLKSKAKYLA